MKNQNIVGVIPARYESSRLPGKIIADIGGKPMIQHVYENALKSKYLSKVIVAVDNEIVKMKVEEFGGEAIMTDPNLPSGTDRVAAAVRHLDCDIVCNIQGDEPFCNPKIIDEAIEPLIGHPEIGFSTVMHSIDDEAGYNDTGVVKVVRDNNYFGLYFSRSLIPYPRKKDGYKAFEHVGIYVYTKDALMKFVTWSPSYLEQIESLEMLRIIENGEKIYVAESKVESYTLSVDTQEDLEKARELYEKILKEQGEK